MQDLPEDLRQRWQEFVDVQLAQANRNNEIVPVKVKQRICWQNIFNAFFF